MARVQDRVAGSNAAGNKPVRGSNLRNRPRNSKIHNNPNFKLESASESLEALFDFYVDAERAVVIAQSHNRYVSVHVVFHLDDLLLRRTHIRYIGDRQVARD